MMKLAKTCFIAAVAAGATLPTMAESTAAAPQTRPQVTVKDVAAHDAADIEQRMKAIRLPAISFAPPMTIVDAIEFFCKASKKHDSAKIPEEKRGFNFILKNDNETTAPTLPSIQAADISFYDALKLVCESVGYMFYVDNSFVFVMSQKEYAQQKVTLAEHEIEERMKAIRLPEVAFEQPKTIADAVKFFYEASKNYDTDVTVEKRGFNMILQTGGAAAPEIPMLRLREVSFYDALKFVCARVDYTFEINYVSDLSDVIVTIKPCDNSKSSDAK